MRPHARHGALVIALSVLAMIPVGVEAQTTGSRLSSAPPHPMARIRFDEPSELGAIRTALADGEVAKAPIIGFNVRPNAKAREIAKTFLASDLSPDMQYVGLNALCAVESAARNWQAALDACNRAIRIRSSFWMAINTRGTVYLMTGDVEKARADFRRAYELVPDRGGNKEIVRHNLALVGVTPDEGNS